MPSEATDSLSPCLSLPNILTYLNYDEVVRCMQVNKTINNTIHRDWNIMQRKKIYLHVDIDIQRGVKYIVEIIFSEKDRDARHKVIIRNRHWEYSCTPRIPMWAKKLLEENSVQDPRKGTGYNNRFWAYLEMKPDIDGLEVLLKALLPRVNITTMTTQVRHISESELMKSVMTLLTRYYSKKHNNAVLTVKDSDYLPVYNEIAKTIGAAKIRLSYSADKWICRLTDIDTATMEIFVDQRYSPNAENIYNRVTELLLETYILNENNNMFNFHDWQAGVRIVKRLGLRADNWDVSLFWKDLCSELGVSSHPRTTAYGESFEFIQLRRYVDDSLLEISFYADQHELNIEQL